MSLHLGQPPQPSFQTDRDASLAYLRAAWVLVDAIGADEVRALADRVEAERIHEHADEIVAVLRWLAR